MCVGQAGALSTPNCESPDTLKLKKAASEFEALLLAKWWSSMKESGIGGDADRSDPGHDTLDEMGIQAMSAAVASRGGLGIGRMLVGSFLSNARAGRPSATEDTAQASKSRGQRSLHEEWRSLE